LDLLRAPFPYFGTKIYIAQKLWELMGSPKHYIEPFAGAMGCLLSRPSMEGCVTETVNDLSGHLVNFWRAIKFKPEETARECSNLVAETELAARWKFLYEYDYDALVKALRNDLEYCDPKVAGAWAHGTCGCIGGGIVKAIDRITPEFNSKMSFSASGILRLNWAHNLDPTVPESGREIEISHWFKVLQNRIQNVRILCGSWERVFVPGLLKSEMLTILLDPPYDGNNTRLKMYGDQHGNNASRDVRDWCLEYGNRENLSILLCGYGDEHDVLCGKGWKRISWVGKAGYSASGSDQTKKEKPERIWISPTVVKRQSCIKPF